LYNLLGYEVISSTRRFVVEENPTAGEKPIGFTIINSGIVGS
jgi:hypothetical protein